MSGATHTFHAIAFVENVSLKELGPSYPSALRTPHALSYAVEPAATGGVLTLDRLTRERASIVAQTSAQSASMEYYEGIADEMSVATRRIVLGLERRGTVSLRRRPLHRFIGAAMVTRNEVINVLHLLDKPDEAWDDPEMDRIYDELRAEFSPSCC